MQRFADAASEDKHDQFDVRVGRPADVVLPVCALVDVAFFAPMIGVKVGKVRVSRTARIASAISGATSLGPPMNTVGRSSGLP